MEPLEDILFLHPHLRGFAMQWQGDKVNYRRYINGRVLDISYLRGRLRRLFSVLSDADYDGVQKLLEEAERILKKYITGEN